MSGVPSADPPAAGRRLMDKKPLRATRLMSGLISKLDAVSLARHSMRRGRVTFTVEVEQETDGRWIGEVP